jgi:hypothetical protein
VNNATSAATGRVGRMINFVQGQSHLLRRCRSTQLASKTLDVSERAGVEEHGAQWLV